MVLGLNKMVQIKLSQSCRNLCFLYKNMFLEFDLLYSMMNNNQDVDENKSPLDHLTLARLSSFK
jgi:hypothetical protein